MDSVRFGRALGFGARSAARALSSAVDAATAPNPTPVKASPDRPASQQVSSPAMQPRLVEVQHRAQDPVTNVARSAAHTTVQAQVRARQASQGVARGSKRFGQAVWGPFVKMSGVLWLEMTGAFFGIFALFAGQAAWAHRADILSVPGNHESHVHALVFLIMATVFGYFCISSFVRAWRR